MLRFADFFGKANEREKEKGEREGTTEGRNTGRRKEGQMNRAFNLRYV